MLAIVQMGSSHPFHIFLHSFMILIDTLLIIVSKRGIGICIIDQVSHMKVLLRLVNQLVLFCH